MNFFINTILSKNTVDEKNLESDRMNSDRVLINKNTESKHETELKDIVTPPKKEILLQI